MQSYFTSRYLYVPEHGSPNTLVDALTVHDVVLLHSFRRRIIVELDLHDVVSTFFSPLQCFLERRPKFAYDILNIFRALQAKVKFVFSQATVDFLKES